MTVFDSGWEDSGGSDVTDDGKWGNSSGTLDVISIGQLYGLYSLRATGSVAQVVKTLASGYATLYFRFEVKLDDVTNYTELLKISNAAYGQTIVVGVQNGKWFLASPSGTTYNLGVAVIDTKYCVEARRTVGTGDGIAALWVDGDLLSNKTTETLTGDGKVLQFGHPYRASGDAIGIFDSVIASETYIGPPEEPPGEEDGILVQVM